MISERCQEGLAELNDAASEADDAQAVASGDDSPSGQRKRAVAAVRRGERVALSASLGWWQRDLELLNLKEYYQERRLKDLGLDKEWSEEDIDMQDPGGRQAGSLDW